MINTLIHPGVRVMQRLNLPAKFMLISAAFLVPLAVTLYAVVDYADQGIHFAERELVGTSYIPVLNEVTEKAMRLRDAGAASVSTGELSGELTATRAALTSLQKLIDSDHDTLAMAQLSTQLANDISSARGSAVASSTEALVGRLFGSYADIGDNSNLILDPDLDSFYLMSIVVDAGPKLLDALGSLRTQLKQPVANSGKDNLRMTLARVATARDSIHQAIVRGTKANPVVTQRVPSAEWESQQRELFGLSESLESDVAASRDRLQPVVEHAIESTLKLADDSNKLLVDLLNTRISGFTLRKYQVIALTLACLAGSAYLIAAFYLSNIRGFGALTDRLKKLAGGDLTANYPARGSDEIGQLINSFNLSRAELQQLVLHIHSASDAIGAAGTQIAAVNNDLAQRGAEQSAVISQTAERMQSISGKILDNMHRSENANRLAENAFEKAERGKAVVDDVVVKMDAMTESSRRIATITTVINEIAFQTNLLALNAAVEAARAGEQGRGFAVVAAEVGNLAQRSATAANEIRKLIEASVDDVEAGAKLVAVAGGTMTEILSAVSSVSEIMSEMARASKVQSHDIEAVESAVARIDSDAQQNAGIVEQTAAAAGMLHVQVTSLLKSVSHFRLVTDAEPIQTRNTQTLNAAIESGFSSRVA